MCPAWATRRTSRRASTSSWCSKGTNLLHIATIDYHLAPNAKAIDIAIARSVLAKLG